ncbi:ABC transporter ATP-binding protein [Paenibacillus sp. PL2-23]|uniref:ABC transporter ATP-binding protein n=1 Tax=Paenibacillus sp. PL2-23 TaxID=2100729 RepID=UPI0030FCD30F
MTQLLQVEGLIHHFGATAAVRGISFEVLEGRCTALLGPNGAGKTTTIRIIAGLLKPTEGAIRFKGLRPGEDARGLLGYLPQSPAFHHWMTGMEYMEYAGQLYGMSRVEAKQRAVALLERVGLKEAAKRRIGGYSGGMKQRLGLAQALVHRPKLLIMDEPVSALDPVGRREVMGLLQELKGETSILFSTHVLPDAEELCEDIVIIRQGEVALQGSLEQIRHTHRKPVIELKLEDADKPRIWAEGFMKKLGSNDSAWRPLFRKAEQHGVTIKLTVEDLPAARQAVLQELAQEGIDFVRIEAGYSSLEDLFMKVVGV